jgi:hybrid cluster-associated redox disulfide protein
LANKSKPKIIAKEGIRGDMTIAEVVTHYPQTMAVFFRHGMTCFGCPMALQETVSQGAEAHGMDPDDLLKELNSAISNAKKSPISSVPETSNVSKRDKKK